MQKRYFFAKDAPTEVNEKNSENIHHDLLTNLYDQKSFSNVHATQDSVVVKKRKWQHDYFFTMTDYLSTKKNHCTNSKTQLLPILMIWIF